VKEGDKESEETSFLRTLTGWFRRGIKGKGDITTVSSGMPKLCNLHSRDIGMAAEVPEEKEGASIPRMVGHGGQNADLEGGTCPTESFSKRG